jgi:Xaa-Pro aminopeptidase
LLAAVDHLPLCSALTPPLNRIPDSTELSARKAAQDLALRCAAETAHAIAPGWSERQAARFMRDWLGNHGVRDWFHRPLVFFGERTRYHDFAALTDLRPTDRILQDNDIYILDAGPVVNGLAVDVSITGQCGEVPGYAEATKLLQAIRTDLPGLVRQCGLNGQGVWQSVRTRIEQHGFDPVHQTSPYSFFGHRLNGTRGFPLARILAGRGRQTYSEFFARGLAGQLWSGTRQSALTGIWAVEPHIGAAGFGVKFEESLIVTPDYVGWLRDLNL